jgi:hypothetical protein
VVDVADGADVDVRLVAIEICHDIFLVLWLLAFGRDAKRQKPKIILLIVVKTPDRRVTVRIAMNGNIVNGVLTWIRGT